uniref:UDP-glucose ceramide glucosyltransferase-like 1 n=1 Tax=Rousettus aegyptiacus TaxID=9407 RepID=A0A7J8E064_ROUAE|nr:UDP-glucose glycoprotein glucosyltransferase 2 [Rousettus aegyptiacus]
MAKKAATLVQLLLGSTILWLSLLRSGTVSASKSVTASLAAKWPETPLLLEASEFMAEESNEKFWQFLDTVKELAIYKQTESDYSHYNLILKKAGQFLDNLHINLLKFALSLRAYSPTIQMFQQIAADEPPPDGCDAFVVIHKKHTCKINEIKKLLKKATSRPRPYLFKGDHKFPTNKENLPVIILYAEMGTRAFGKFHRVLSEKAQNGEILYVLRHYIQKPTSQKMYLSGYGVELVIKSTEYKALDDTQVKTVTNTTVEGEIETNEVQGFLFGKLKERYSDLRDNLTAFQKYLIESNKEMMPLKVWELQDLSFQAASQIMSTPVYDAIKLMKDISQNFPIKARSLTRIAVNQHLRKEIQENQKDLQNRFEIQPGDAFLYINGLRIDIDAYDPFSILDMLKLEGKMMNGLHNLGINGEYMSKFLKLNSHVWDNTYVLDIRHSSVMWINDLENDELYVMWPTSCQELLKPILPGSIPSIRRNFHNLILFIDPAQEYTMDFIKLAERLYYHKIPLRIGFVFIINTDDEVDGMDDAGVALWRAFNYIADEHDVSQAFISITHMYQKVKKQNTLTVDNVKSVLQNKFPSANVQDILGIHSIYDDERKAGANFYKMIGLGPLPQALFNGESFNREELNIKELEMAVLQKMIDTTIYLQRESSIIMINPQENDVFFDVIGIVDPLTREAQKMAQLLNVLGKIINMKIKLFLNCRGKLSEAPLKSFYRFVLEPELTFVADDIGPVAKFLDIPESPLLTLNMITPEGWLVETVHSNCDLDNIHLEDIEGTVIAEYELEYLLLEGHCFDIMTEQPPRGLQFTLGTKNQPVAVDTIVMANLGYFQLKANPGAWLLKLRQGKSEDIYQIVGHEGTDSQPDQGDAVVVLNSFRSKIIEVQVQKKPDKIKEDILNDKDGKKGMWDSIKSFTRSLHKEKDKTETDVLNIFSVASGHLYERFLRIMMLSVLRNTKTPVKFWFLKNYLSPTFKEVIPHMAKEYGFQYELVQYRWPRWLHQQTEKQRIIWGYKILFLDVLFPLAVDKIIFVDADQIVRHDLKELRDFDLDGAPYGYTPFCDSRTEMDGYRFWKTGYWASHLLRRKYHISALYVVDLKKFRRIAAGDRLRGQYQALSQDPNSLSNLDQDLPNNMIYQVAIKSLPQDWLWCETWCDDESKQRAKTIDLCNNPKTKEPKLEAAARIVPEWVEYDNEIRRLLDHLENKKKNEILAHDEL